MKVFISTLPRNLIGCFKGRMIWAHGIALALTVVLVKAGIDWQYFRLTRSPSLRSWAFPAVHLGGLLPILMPLALIAAGTAARDSSARIAGWALGQAEIIAGLIAAGYKAITGRAHPTHGIEADLTRTFHFGFLRGGVFWGWPSSHTTIAFAMAFTVVTLFPRHRWLGRFSMLYALYIGIGVSMTIHWFSDFIAGAIIGAVVGVVVGRSFLAQPRPEPIGSCPAAKGQTG